MDTPIFESLRIWHDARRLAARIYDFGRDGRFGGDYSFRNQIQRAALSVMSNIAEGSERQSGKEFVRFLRIAKGSVAEVRSQIYLGQDAGYFDDSLAIDLRQQAVELSRGIAALIRAEMASWRPTSS